MLMHLESGPIADDIPPQPVTPDEDWLAGACGDIVCPQCRRIDRTQYPRPLDVVFCDPPSYETSVLLEGTGITVFRRDLVDYLRDHLAGFVLGECFLDDGSAMDEYVTCYGRDYVIVRGGRNSRNFVCNGCGMILSDLGPGPRYVIQQELTGASVYQDAQCGLYLAEELGFEIDLGPWIDAFLAGIGVRERPIEGQPLPGSES